MRINAYLALQLGLSRRQADRMIHEGKVSINGRLAELGQQFYPEQDRLELEGKPVSTQPPVPVTVALYKPRACVSSRTDPQGRPTVMDLLPPELKHLKPVGRLDYDSEGLLLLSNDGQFIHRSTHPSFETEKEYRMLFKHPVTQGLLRSFRRGIPLEEGIARADRLQQVSPQEINLVLHQGWNRQLRRMAAACDAEISRLIRIREGDIRLEGLEPGQWREVALTATD